jgi:bifunctional non-homologous end joining protein LigD
MPVAAPVAWDELERIDSADAFGIADADQLLRRAGLAKLRGWGMAEQRLPRLA